MQQLHASGQCVGFLSMAKGNLFVSKLNDANAE